MDDVRRTVILFSTSRCIVAATVAATVAIFAAAGTAAAAAGQLKVELKPRYLLIATGDNLTVNCTLSHSRPGLSAKDLIFTVDNNSPLNASAVVSVVTERRAALTVVNVQRNMSGSVGCRHRATDVAPDVMRVLVADKPKKPSINCTVFNWENMTCSWDAQEDNGIPTDISVGYSTVRTFTPGNTFEPCPNLDLVHKRSCSWFLHDTSHRYINGTHWLLIQVANDLGNDYDLKRFDSEEHAIVKPSSVRSLSCVARSSQSCYVAWSSPAPGRNLDYRIRYQSHWDKDELVVRTKETLSTVTDLVPDTGYRLIVDCIPLIGDAEAGFWSEPQSCDCRTQTDVPAMNPPVTFGAYRVLTTDDGHGQRRIQFHWQPIPRRWSNGEITAVRLRVRNRSEFFSDYQLIVTIPWNASDLKTSWNSVLPEAVSGFGNVSMFNSSVTNATVELDSESTYIVTVDAQTSAGFNESLEPLSIVIPKKNDAPPFPETFVVSTDFIGRYYLFFNASMSPNASGYTTYWCTTPGNRPDICLSPYNWTRISPVQADHELELPGHACNNVHFHVSVESVLPSGETVSSGMQPVDSIYSRDEVVRMPRNVHFSEGAKDSESLTIQWDVDRSYCKRHSVYISHYIIRYCSTTCHEMRVEGSADVARVGGLLPGTVYRIQMKGCFFGRESNFTESIIDTTLLPPQGTLDSRKDVVLAAVSIATAGIILLCVLLICCQLRRVKRSILIVMPKKCSLPPVEAGQQSDGYRIQALPIPIYNTYLNCNSQSIDSGQEPCVVTYSTPTTTDPYCISSHFYIQQIIDPRNQYSSASIECPAVRDSSTGCLRILPDLRSSEVETRS